ncbi:MAG: HemK2/MTQ2 family protein methyltransferase [Halobacteriaceae archaeon]
MTGDDTSAGGEPSARAGAGVFADGQVYQPAEDSRLLLEAAREGIGAGDRVLDVGTGSGYVAVEVAAATGASVVATDVNPHACRAARERAAAAGVPVAVVRADLLAAVCGRFDAVLFNPPYLPDAAPPDADAAPVPDADDWLSVAVSGGESGRAVVAPFIEDVGRVLAPGGAVYLLVSSLMDVEAVLDLADEAELGGESVARDSFPFETLSVLRLTRDRDIQKE